MFEVSLYLDITILVEAFKAQSPTVVFNAAFTMMRVVTWQLTRAS